jgi:hypothetical protein
MPLYEIDFIQKYTPDETEQDVLQESDYSSVIFQFKFHKGRNFESEIYEAILLLLLLEKEGYIFFNLFSLNYEKETIGEKIKIMTPLGGDCYESERIFDVFPGNRLWGLLNSNCIITNSLKDYAKDFKTEEQRRFRTSFVLTCIAIIISLISCISGCFSLIYR